jgi:hypothetical protein
MAEDVVFSGVPLVPSRPPKFSSHATTPGPMREGVTFQCRNERPLELNDHDLIRLIWIKSKVIATSAAAAASAPLQDENVTGHGVRHSTVMLSIPPTRDQQNYS